MTGGSGSRDRRRSQDGMAAGTGGTRARADVDRASDVDASSSAVATMAGDRSRGGILSSARFC